MAGAAAAGATAASDPQNRQQQNYSIEKSDLLKF
jgi:hypothetical protein